jgi:branched-chain amino acid transport system permease protein
MSLLVAGQVVEAVIQTIAAGLPLTVATRGFFAVLIAFVMFEPMGLYGRWLKIRTWIQLFPFYRKGMFKRQKSFQKSDRLK